MTKYYLELWTNTEVGLAHVQETLKAANISAKLITIPPNAPCPHCKGQAFLGMSDSPDSRGAACGGCDGFGKNSGCVAIDPELADRREMDFETGKDLTE